MSKATSLENRRSLCLGLLCRHFEETNRKIKRGEKGEIVRVTISQADAGFFGVNRVQNPLVTNLALRCEAYQAPDIRVCCRCAARSARRSRRFLRGCRDGAGTLRRRHRRREQQEEREI